MELTSSQEIKTEGARQALEFSRKSTDYAGCCGLLEYSVTELLAVIAELTGAK